MDDLAGRTAVITGGASGIGLATAESLPHVRRRFDRIERDAPTGP